MAEQLQLDVVTPDRQPYEGDPRDVLRRAIQRAGLVANWVSFPGTHL